MTDNAIKNLVAAIILQAVKDWDTLMRKNVEICRPQQGKMTVSFDEIRKFFKSEYGQSLCVSVNLSADDILAKLEKRLAQNKPIDELLAI